MSSWSKVANSMLYCKLQEQAKRRRREVKRSSKRRKAAQSSHDLEDGRLSRSPDHTGSMPAEKANVPVAPPADERKLKQHSSEAEDTDLAEFLISLLP